MKTGGEIDKQSKVWDRSANRFTNIEYVPHYCNLLYSDPRT